MILTLSAIVNDNFIRSETANKGNVQTGQQDTVDSRYLEVEGTLRNTLRYP